MNEPLQIKYFKKVYELSNRFKAFDMTYVPRELNSRANLLSKLSSTKRSSYNQPVIQETLFIPSIKVDKSNALEVSQTNNLMTPIIRYPLSNDIPSNELEAKNI